MRPAYIPMVLQEKEVSNEYVVTPTRISPIWLRKNFLSMYALQSWYYLL